MSIWYYQDGNGSSLIVEETVFAVGFNDDFIIAKSHPKNSNDSIIKNITEYHLININKTEQKRKEFSSKSEEFHIVFKDKNGIDSLRKKQEYFTKFYPKKSIPLTLDQFEYNKKRLNVPEELNFTIIFEELE